MVKGIKQYNSLLSRIWNFLSVNKDRMLQNLFSSAPVAGDCRWKGLGSTGDFQEKSDGSTFLEFLIRFVINLSPSKHNCLNSQITSKIYNNRNSWSITGILTTRTVAAEIMPGKVYSKISWYYCQNSCRHTNSTSLQHLSQVLLLATLFF